MQLDKLRFDTFITTFYKDIKFLPRGLEHGHTHSANQCPVLMHAQYPMNCLKLCKEAGALKHREIVG